MLLFIILGIKLFKHDFFRQNFISFCNKRRGEVRALTV